MRTAEFSSCPLQPGRPKDRDAPRSWSRRGWARGLVTLAVATAGIAPLAAPARSPRGLAPASQRPVPLPDIDIVERTIPQLQALMADGRLTARQLVEAYLARIEAYDRQGPRLNTVMTINPHARQIADELDAERAARGPRGPLHGIPLLVKDNMETIDMPTTAASLALATFDSGRDAFVVRRLREAGAIILGKTNLHELASGITTVSSLGGQTKNPYDLARNPGGSSGGTGAAVAANFAAAGLGTDTCGSIRIPASHNNLVGLRGTFGLVSRDGIVPLSHSQDVVGPLARSVVDLAILLDTIVGVDPADPTTRRSDGQLPESYRDRLDPRGLAGARIGLLTELLGSGPDEDEAAALVRKALDTMQRLGAQVVDVSIPAFDDLLRDTSVIDGEFKFDLMDYLAARPEAPVRSLAEILDRGLYHAAIEATARRRNAVAAPDTDAYRKTLARRERLRAAVLAALASRRLDALAYPTMRRKAAPIGELQRGSTCQLSASTGLPALSLPAGFTDDGLPMGLELLGRPFSEPVLLRLASAYEQATGWRRLPDTTPPLVDGHAPPPVSFEVVATGAELIPPGNSPVRVACRFTFDAPTGTLEYLIRVIAPPDPGPIVVTIHRGAAGQTGPVVFTLLRGEARTVEGALTLGWRERTALRAGELYLAVYTRTHPLGAARGQLVLP